MNYKKYILGLAVRLGVRLGVRKSTKKRVEFWVILHEFDPKCTKKGLS